MIGAKLIIDIFASLDLSGEKEKWFKVEEDNLKIQIDDLEILSETFGENAKMGELKRAIMKITNNEVIVKKVRTDVQDLEKRKRCFIHEVGIRIICLLSEFQNLINLHYYFSSICITNA